VLGRTLLWLSESPRFERFVRGGRLSRPVVARFVAGDSADEAIEAIARLNADGVGGILDLLGEGVADAADTRAAAEEYRDSIQRSRAAGVDTTVSVKLSQLGLEIDRDLCLENLRSLAASAREADMLLEVDMEQSSLVDATLDVFRRLRADHDDVRLAMQAYLRRTEADLEAMRDLAPRIRLVKGAYAEPPELALQSRAEIDATYRRLTEWLFDHGTDPGIATHDKALIDHAVAAAEARGAGRRGFVIQMLYGVRAELQAELAAAGYRVRTYVPFGAAWYPYLMRRMAERPANLRFVLRAMVSG